MTDCGSRISHKLPKLHDNTGKSLERLSGVQSFPSDSFQLLLGRLHEVAPRERLIHSDSDTIVLLGVFKTFSHVGIDSVN
jgi:hypothetical protein